MAAADATIQGLIVEYLESKKISSSDPDGVDVAIQCIVEGFGVSPEVRARARALGKLEDLLAATTASSAPTTGAEPEDAAFAKFVSSLKGMGFFDGAEKGSPEYRALLEKAKDKFEQRGAAAGESAAAPAAAAANDEAGAEAAKARGNEHHGAGRNREAIECYTEAVALAPSGRNVHVYYANRSAARAGVRDYEGAIADAEASIAANATWPKAHGRLGTALQLAGRHAAAVSAFEEALRLDPANEAARSNLADARTAVAAAGGAGGGARGAVAGRPAPAAGGAGGAANPFAGLGGLGGAGGLAGLMSNPMVQQMMSNPQMQQMAQQMMSNPQALQQMMGSLGGAGGLAGLMGGLGGGGGGGGGGLEGLSELEGDDDMSGLDGGGK